MLPAAGASDQREGKCSKGQPNSSTASRERQRMTYCIGILLKDGIVLASDSRTNAGVDNFSKFCKMTVFERAGDRVIILLSSGNLAGTQAVISLLKQRSDVTDGPP